MSHLLQQSMLKSSLCLQDPFLSPGKQPQFDWCNSKAGTFSGKTHSYLTPLVHKAGSEKRAHLRWDKYAFGRSFCTPGWATYRHVLFGRETALQGLGIGEGVRELRSKKDFQPLTNFPNYRRYWNWPQGFWLRRRGSV